MSAQWTRNMPWHQGAILTAETVQTLGLATGNDGPDSLCVMVISHDCDLANDNLDQEPDVEIIIGRKLERGNGNYYWAKSPRTLHIDAHCKGETAIIELLATARRTISKTDLAPFSPDSDWQMSDQGVSALRTWLAARYHRTAFPDEFVDRLSHYKLGDKLATLMKKDGEHISNVYFDLDQGAQKNHSDGTPYQLSIVLAFLPGEDPEATQNAMDALADRIQVSFEQKLFNSATGDWHDICLKQCMAISEDDMTLSQARRLQPWRLEHLSIKGGEGHALPVS